jgi:non-ribosomal peptide synthetase component F
VVILNKEDPPARLAKLLDDAEPPVLLTAGGSLARAREIADARLCLIKVDALEDGAAERINIGRGPDDTAFLVYTSGSTGQPKGVMQTHGQLLRSILALGRALGITLDDRVLLVSSLWGAQALSTPWLAFMHGAALVWFPAAENGWRETCGRKRACMSCQHFRTAQPLPFGMTVGTAAEHQTAL